jgi:hypothetical protein
LDDGGLEVGKGREVAGSDSDELPPQGSEAWQFMYVDRVGESETVGQMVKSVRRGVMWRSCAEIQVD